MNPGSAGHVVVAAKDTRSCKIRSFIVLILISGVYFYAAALRSWTKPYWYDEFATLHLARLQNFGDVWTALQNGFDLHPPLLFALTRLSVSVFGDNPLAMRLPGMIGFWMMGICIYKFASPHLGRGAAAVGMVVPCLTGAFEYASEARPYGLLLGLSGCVMLTWRAAASEGGARRFYLPALTLALASALLTHCHAVLLLIALACAEIIRWRIGKRLDWPLYAAVLASAVVVPTYFPLLQHSKRLVAHTWAPPEWPKALLFYDFLLRDAFYPALIALLAFSLFVMIARTKREAPARSFPFPLHEGAFLFVLLLFPLLGVLIGKVITGSFTDRYALPAVLGVAVVTATVVATLGAGIRFIGTAVAVLLLEFVALGAVLSPASWRDQEGGERFKASNGLERLVDRNDIRGLPIAISSGLTFVQLCWYAPPALASRLVYLRDPEAAIEFGGSDVLDISLPEIRKWFPVDLYIADYDKFTKAQSVFLVYGPYSGLMNWLPTKLVSDRLSVQVLGSDGIYFLFKVTTTAPAGNQEPSRDLKSMPAAHVEGARR